MYKADPSQPRIGFIAEEVPEVFGNADRNGVDTMGITAALTVVVQQQQQQLAQLAQLLGPLVADVALPPTNIQADVDLGSSVFLTLDMFAEDLTLPSTDVDITQEFSIDTDFVETVLTSDPVYASREAFADFVIGWRSELTEIDSSTQGIDDQLVDLWGENSDWLHDIG